MGNEIFSYHSEVEVDPDLVSPAYTGAEEIGQFEQDRQRPRWPKVFDALDRAASCVQVHNGVECEPVRRSGRGRCRGRADSKKEISEVWGLNMNHRLEISKSCLIHRQTRGSKHSFEDHEFESSHTQV
jgi:hypothetical protein